MFLFVILSVLILFKLYIIRFDFKWVKELISSIDNSKKKGDIQQIDKDLGKLITISLFMWLSLILEFFTAAYLAANRILSPFSLIVFLFIVADFCRGILKKKENKEIKEGISPLRKSFYLCEIAFYVAVIISTYAGG